MRHEPTDDDALRHEQFRARRPQTGAPLERPRRSGRVLGGVAAGIARFVGADVRVVRALWVASTIASLGIVAFGYLALWVLLPLEAPMGGGARRAPSPTSAPSVDGAVHDG